MARPLVALLVVSCMSFCAMASLRGDDAARSLTTGEVWSLHGGGIANTCCAVLTHCGFTSTLCNIYPTEAICNAGVRRSEIAGNKKSCVQSAPMTTCNESSATHVCIEVYQCLWYDGACVQRSTTPYSIVNAPDTCSPTCM
jgi:hypothetical protein